MEFFRPATWSDALAIRAGEPGALPLAGGTDVMVDINFDRARPAALLDLTGIGELAEWSASNGVIRLGAGVPYARVISELAGPLPGLALAARTVGSPQIRNRGTVGGNLGSASPAGDAHPPLLACDTVVLAESLRGTRRIPIREFYTGVKRSDLAADELIAAVEVPAAGGPQQFAKVGVRNAMVIAVASVAFVVDLDRHEVAVGLGAVGPGPLGAPEACRWLARQLHWDDEGVRLADPGDAARFGTLVTEAARPIDDHRGRADYRRHAVGVLATRAVKRAVRGGMS